MAILLSGPEWKFKGFVPQHAFHRKVWTADYDWSSWDNAVVPGNAQLDLLRIGVIDDPYRDFNSRCAEWVADRQWAYARSFSFDPQLAGRRVILRFDGIDYAADIYLNHQHLGHHTNMWFPAEFDVTELLKPGDDNQLMVIVAPAPADLAQSGRTSDVRTFKPRMNYGWDFAARCISIGIWRDVKLVVSDGVRITDTWAHAVLSEDQSRGDVDLVTTIDSSAPRGVEVVSRVFLGDEEVASNSTQMDVPGGEGRAAQTLSIADPRLWWPNGHGEQPVYTAQVAVKDTDTNQVLDRSEVNFGFKRVRLIPNPGQPEGLPPWNFEVNGKRIYIKGWNWVPIDDLYGGDYTQKLERLMRLAVEANVNMLRVWGGGIIESAQFYDLCDRYGIMVWQEFPLSGSGLDNTPSTDRAYLAELEQVAEAVVPTRRSRVSHTVWCCGNELTWTGEQDPAMRTVGEVCRSLDPQKPYVPTCPMWTGRPGEAVEIDIHGQWWFQGVDEHYEMYNKRRPAFHSEFGAEGAANYHNVKRFIRDAKLLPIDLTNPIYQHRGEDWLVKDTMLAVFGEIEDPELFFRLSQFLQWEGLRYIVESGRRRKYECGGTIPWQFNEPWPNLFCSNCVDYYTDPKMAYYAVAKAYAPVHISARYTSLRVSRAEKTSVQLYTNNTLAAQNDVVAQWVVQDLAGREIAHAQQTFDLPGNAACRLDDAQWVVPADCGDILMLFLKLTDAAGNLLSKNAYFFSAAQGPVFAGVKDLPETQIKVLGSRQVPDQGGSRLSIDVANSGESCALFVSAIPKGSIQGVFFRNNHLVLPPGERQEIDAFLTSPVSEFEIRGWNTNTQNVP